jgi:HlyD family secretion protein
MFRDTSGTDRALDSRPTSLMARWRWPVAAVLALFALTALGIRFWSSERSVDSERLRFAVVERGTLVRDVVTDGRIVAADSPSVYAPENGSIQLVVEAGQTVKAGDLLAQMDAPELLAELHREQSLLASQSADAGRARIESERLRRNARKRADEAEALRLSALREFQRNESGYQKGAIAEVDFLRAKDALQAAETSAQHAAEDAELEQQSVSYEESTRRQNLALQQGVVRELQRRIAELKLRAPVSGVVGTIFVQDRAKLAQNTLALGVVDLSRLEVEIQVPEIMADDLALGMQASISWQSQTLDGTLTSISPEVVGSEVRARVAFAGAMPPGLRQNQRLSTRIRDGIARKTAIRLGASSIQFIEVLEGLQVGDRVVISGSELFETAERIRILE